MESGGANNEVEELRGQIAAQELELESLRVDRLRMQQILDAIENEMLPGYTGKFWVTE